MAFWSTLRIAARMWQRTPALAVVIISTLAFAIGTTTTAFARGLRRTIHHATLLIDPS